MAGTGARRVHPVAGLLPDQAGRAVDDLGVDLLPAVGGEAVEKDGPR
jgi:hypothetical protein